MRDARRFHRRPVDLLATLTIDGGAAESCRVENLSIGGAQVVLRSLPLGARLRLSFPLAAVGERIEAAATVMWGEGSSVGVRFDGLRARETWALSTFFDVLDAPQPRV